MASRGEIIERNRRAYDAMYRMITDRDQTARRQFVAGLEEYLTQRFRVEMTNEDDPLFRETLRKFFHMTARDDKVANMLQMYAVHICICLDGMVVKDLCPPPPNPDTDDADLSKVDRKAFAVYQQKYLLPMMEDLIHGKEMTVPVFVRNLNAAYTALLPPDPIADHEATAGRRNRRIVHFETVLTTTFAPL